MSAWLHDIAAQPLRLFIVAGEHSGDRLGGRLLEELQQRCSGQLVVAGVGDRDMAVRGMAPLFPMDDIAVMGFAAPLFRLRLILRRIRETAAAAIDFKPDAVVIIDSPEFTHRVAARIKAAMPDVPVIDYVCPSVWAWRPGRAKVMARHIDHVLALLPFEPAALARLGGPPATYVGHPLTERRQWIASLDPQELAGRLGLAPGRPVVVVLPGSRRSEVTRLLTPFRQTLTCLTATAGPIEIIIPTVDHVRPLIEADLPQWPIRPHLVNGEADKFKAFRLATASLAASGTVTLELAVAGSPMVVAYKADWLVAALRFLIRVPSVVLANLVLDEAAFPEFLQEAATPATLAAALQPLLREGPERAAQLAALARIDARMATDGGTPSGVAAAVVMRLARRPTITS